ncbi:MAG: hypothetical protein C5B51_15180 [Terriglobia bacterium]|nr:MAG: hypothetical protein C5B51_15180 [Terriglobia bacterium]
MCLAFVVSQLQAQVERTLTLHIPFNFVATDKTLPAGDYMVRTNADSTVLLRDGGGRNASFAIAHAALAPGIRKEAKLVFYRFGEQYFLYEIWGGDTAVGSQLLVAPGEHLSASNWPHTRIEIAATIRASGKEKKP